MNIVESIITALTSIRANALRSFLTLISIAIGTFAIISVGIATTSLNDTVLGAIDEVGGNSFVIKRTPSINMGNSWRRYARRKIIGVQQAAMFKKEIGQRALVSVADEDPAKTVKHGNASTNPDIMIWGSDENYFTLRNKTLAVGRPIVPEDLIGSKFVAVIGNDVKEQLFPNVDPIGKEITIDNYRFEVVGVLEAKGAVLGQSQDKEVYIPLPVYVKGFANDSHFSATITVKATDTESFATIFDEAIGVMRSIRNVAPGAENDFEIEDNSTIKDQFQSFVNFIGYFAAIVAGFSLLAAGIGIMNIMLISVKERTREIGVRKALGATNRTVLTQFLIEAVTVCQLGGAIGIVLAIMGSIALSAATETALSLPYGWIIGSVSICIFIGVVFGLYPAYKAANLDPIDALRYE